LRRFEKCLTRDLLKPNESSWFKRGGRGWRDESRKKRLRRGIGNDSQGRPFMVVVEADSPFKRSAKSVSEARIA
jgi:hypothetical protein